MVGSKGGFVSPHNCTLALTNHIFSTHVRTTNRVFERQKGQPQWFAPTSSYTKITPVGVGLVPTSPTYSPQLHTDVHQHMHEPQTGYSNDKKVTTMVCPYVIVYKNYTCTGRPCAYPSPIYSPQLHTGVHQQRFPTQTRPDANGVFEPQKGNHKGLFCNSCKRFSKCVTLCVMKMHISVRIEEQLAAFLDRYQKQTGLKTRSAVIEKKESLQSNF